LWWLSKKQALNPPPRCTTPV